jgi:ABC-type dipeptide/oligopeptide/nickel transport system permease subunit
MWADLVSWGVGILIMMVSASLGFVLGVWYGYTQAWRKFFP